MTRLDDYRSALLATEAGASAAELGHLLDVHGPQFAEFIVDHGLGPLWHVRTERDEFHGSRLAAEALYAAQERALDEIDAVLSKSGIEYAVIKGVASRLLLHENPAIRACFDIDLLVRPKDRVRAASVLSEVGFAPHFKDSNISRELVLSRDVVDIDLHWGLLREGRLRMDRTDEMLDRRQRCGTIWMLSPEDAFFILIVHPAFAKHLDGWTMGLHRVADIVDWLRTQSFDWQVVLSALQQDGVKTAAWATLRWVELLAAPNTVPGLETMLADLCPGRLRKAWLDLWLRNNFSARTSGARWTRLLGFSLFLHDTPRDALRALIERYRAHRRISADLSAFEGLPG